MIQGIKDRRGKLDRRRLAPFLFVCERGVTPRGRDTDGEETG